MVDVGPLTKIRCGECSSEWTIAVLYPIANCRICGANDWQPPKEVVESE